MYIPTTTLTTTQSAGIDGWVSDAANFWTRTADTTFTTTGDRTAVFSKGTRLRVTDTTTKYFVVVSSSFGGGITTVTITGGTDYVLAANPSAQSYSYAVNPQGYPAFFNHSPAYTGFSADPSGGICYFTVVGAMCTFAHNRDVGTSNNTAFTMTLPIASASVQSSGLAMPLPAQAFDNGAVLTTPGIARMVDGSTTLSMFTNYASAGWQAANGKSAQFIISYRI